MLKDTAAVTISPYGNSGPERGCSESLEGFLPRGQQASLSLPSMLTTV